MTKLEIVPGGSRDALDAGVPPQRFAVSERKPRTVRLLLDGTPNSRKAIGPDYMSQILWMRLDGMSMDDIAAALNCCSEMISAAIECWQTQIEAREGPTFRPRARNARRWRKRSVLALAAA